jgi:Tol biopolymer transport system component
MSLVKPGMQFGPYEVLGELGAGGMGEVLRARDPRLQREVAIKVLPPAYSQDPERLRRFEQEARAVAQLNHPNILAIFDIGTREGAPFIVSELLEGETLRQRVASGALPLRKAVDIGIQVARGLAAAHEKGIIHRDLKPENIFITRDGRAKILDFGLAKLVHDEGEAAADGATVSRHTEAGVVLGTVGYMSPEQVRGRPADARSDLFSFGAILYETLSGKRAFHGETPADVMSSILKDDPPDLVETNRSVNPGLEHIVRHCLEKNPEQRFQSAHDVAFDLELLTTASSTSASGRVQAMAGPRSRRWMLYAAAVIVLAGLLEGAYLAGHSGETYQAPRFQQLTFQRGLISEARFAPDGQTIVYSARWSDDTSGRIYTTRTDGLISRPLDLDRTRLTAISSQGEMAVLQHGRFVGVGVGMLGRVPVAGGAPREILDNVIDADWGPQGEHLAIDHLVGDHVQVEYPVGQVLFTTSGYATDVHVSPDGKHVAFFEHPVYGDDRGMVSVVDSDGKNKRVLSPNWASLNGLVWSRDGKEIWFTASDSGISRSLYAVDLSGHQRTLLRVPGSMRVMDINAEGRVLLVHETRRRNLMGWVQGNDKERDLTWFDWTYPVRVTPDSKWLLFVEQGEGGGPNYSTYIRALDGSPAVRLGEGMGLAISPDGKYVVTTAPNGAAPLMLLPTGAGQPRQIAPGDMSHVGAAFTPDNKIVLFIGRHGNQPPRTYAVPVAGGDPQPVTPDGIAGTDVSPDGKWLLVFDADGKAYLSPVASLQPFKLGSERMEVKAMARNEGFIGWCNDSRSAFVGTSPSPSRVAILKVNLFTGARSPYRELATPDTSGVGGLGPVFITPDGKSYVYGYGRTLSDLYVVDGLK